MMTPEEKAASLRGGLFNDLPEDVLQNIALRMGERTLADNEQLFLNGEPGDEMFVVIEGEIEIHIGDYVIAVLGPGEVFGEMAVLGSGRRTASGRARGDVRLLFLKAKALRVLVQQQPELAFSLFKVLIERLDEANRLARFLATNPTESGHVHIVSGPCAGQRVPLFHAQAPLGRATGSVTADALRIALPVENASTLEERHAHVQIHDGSVFIAPLDGTVVIHGEEIDDYVHVSPEDKVVCGDLTLRFILKEND